MNSFREIIEAFGVARLATLLGIERSHVRVMKVRNVIPPQYWRKILEAPKHVGLPLIDFRMLDDLYVASKEKEGEAADDDIPRAAR